MSRRGRLATLSGEHPVNSEPQRRTAVQAAPAFRYDNGISGVLRIVFYRSGHSNAAVVQIDVLTQMRHVLRRFILDARDIIVVDEKLRGVRLVGVQFRHIDDCAIDQSTDAVEKLSALALMVLCRFFAPRR